MGFEMWAEAHTAVGGFFRHAGNVVAAAGFVNQQGRLLDRGEDTHGVDDTIRRERRRRKTSNQ